MQLLTFLGKASVAPLSYQQRPASHSHRVTTSRSLYTAAPVYDLHKSSLARSSRPQAARCRASRNPPSPSGQSKSVISGFSSLANSRLYSWGLSGVVLLALGALCDAGFSGDWSRQGVLTHEQEAIARTAFLGVSLFHLACTALAYKLVTERGMSKIKYPAKVLAVGFPALLELLLNEPITPEQ